MSPVIVGDAISGDSIFFITIIFFSFFGRRPTSFWLGWLENAVELIGSSRRTFSGSFRSISPGAEVAASLDPLLLLLLFLLLRFRLRLRLLLRLLPPFSAIPRSTQLSI